MLNFVGLQGFAEESKSTGADITSSYKKKKGGPHYVSSRGQGRSSGLHSSAYENASFCLLCEGGNHQNNDILCLETTLNLRNCTLCSKIFLNISVMK